MMMVVGGGWSVYPEVRVSVNNKKKAGPDIMGAEPGARRSRTEGIERQMAVQTRWMECRGGRSQRAKVRIAGEIERVRRLVCWRPGIWRMD